MKKFFTFLMALALVLSLGVSAYAVVDKSDSFYVADYANVLSADTEQRICESSSRWTTLTGCIATIMPTSFLITGA